jgi:nitrogen fixation protein FixH
MSRIGWIPSPSDNGPQQRRSLWRLFPLAVIAGLAVVVAVNAGLVYAALESFPGKSGNAGFALSNHYDAVLEQARLGSELGWAMEASTDDAGRAVVTVTARDGSPLRGATVSGSAERPIGAPATHRLRFYENDGGRYVADALMPMPGQWDLTLSVSSGADDMAATRRIIVH